MSDYQEELPETISENVDLLEELPENISENVDLLEKTLRYFFWLAIPLTFVGMVVLLGPVLAPFIVAAASAYLGDPIVDYLERWKFSRTWSVSIVFVVMTLIMLLAVLILLPLLINQVDLLRQELPRFVEWFDQVVLPRFYSLVGSDSSSGLMETLNSAVTNNWEKISDLAATIIAQATQSGLALVGWLAGLFLTPVVTFYLLRDWDVLIDHISDLLPRKQLPLISRLASECDEVLGQFIRGQLLIMTALTVFYITGLSLMGLKLALLVGIAAGLASVVPYLGALVGILVASLAAYVQFGDLIHVVIALGIFGAGQLLESLFLTPILVGDRIGLHPVAVIFAVVAGGQLFGFVGVLLALPIAAVAMVLVRHAHHSYRNSVFYQ